MTSEPAVRIGAVHIIESLRPHERLTGERLHGVLAPLAAASKPPLSVHFWREGTRAALLDRLRYIAGDVRSRRLAPLVQIETHGSPQGFHLASGECVTWADVKAPLTEINVLCRLNLLVVVGACIGADLTKTIELNDRAPVWGLIGPLRDVGADEIEHANAAFYTTLFASRDGGIATQAMNAAVKKGDSPFHFISAQFMFREVMAAYFKKHCSEEQLTRRLHRLIETMKSDGVPEDALPFFASMLAERLRDHQWFFDQIKPHFFHQDLCPEHAARFPVTLAECLNA
jgi:hypothetical protein